MTQPNLSPIDKEGTVDRLMEEIEGLKAEKKRLKEELEEYHNAEKFVADPPHDQICCNCVPILRVKNKQLGEALNAAREEICGECMLDNCSTQRGCTRFNKIKQDLKETSNGKEKVQQKSI